MHQDNINCQTCQISMSLEAKTHINTICNIWGLTPHGSRKQFAMLILMHEMTSALLADNLPPLPYVLSPMNWLPHHLPIISTHCQCLHLCKDMLWAPASTSLPSPILMLLHPCLIISATYQFWAPALPSNALQTSSLH
ncbi:hypothetical protein O181_003354 [Austropuccinia psidii MF-1]|uniref:Uncharacterized protein n=1 Tax=Austropuccinia psidii MF-1 TaxID=1389203 RepID=A0A9Q3BE86_9BASI|nr:hypothetical protein [Austropuccinia psidii MF-1]